MTWTSGGRLREERRWVSVLFADVVGYTRLSAGLDPEDVRAFQVEYFRRVSQVVRSWNGVVEKFIGDAVLAVFGAPASDEYDACRAVLAGLEIQAALTGLTLPDGSPARVRVGIATGEVMVDLAAVTDGGQAMVCGDVVNTAARVQTHAEPGTVVVTAATRRATAAHVCYREMSPITPAGKPEPIEIWRAERAARVPPVDPRDGVPMVGRQAELCSLVDRVAGAVRDRTPAMVSVVGPAGIGKSRLVHEAAHTVQATEGPVRWWFGHCSPCHRGRYAPLAELVRNQAGVRDDDDAMTIRRRLAAWAGDLVDAADLPRTLAALAALLGLPAESPADTEHPDVARACLRVLLSAARNPLVIVLEDVQHADAAMIQFVRDLLSAAVAAPQPLPLAVVVTHRPEPHRPEPDSPVAADSDLTVVLQPLADRDATRLLRRLLDRTGQPAALADRLTPFASGNPGYAEEYVRSLAEHGAVDGCAGATEVVTPERVRGIVSALLDHLDEPDRAIVQAAAVLGDAVWPDAVAALLGADPAEVHDALRRLEHRGLLRHTATTTAGQTGYVFSQAAVRQVAYARLPRTVRLAYHRDAARWLSAGVARRHRSVDERVRHWLAASALAHLLRLDSRPFLAAASAALAVAARPTIGRDATVRTHAPGSRAYRQRPACRPAIPHRTTNRGPRRARAVVQGRGRSP